MDELALRTLLNRLEASRSSLHGLLHIFTWFVVVGLAFDLIVIIKEFRDDWGEFKYGQTHPYENHLPKHPNVSLLVLALLGTALIVIGVAGEQYVDVQAGKIETKIREANDNLLGLIIQEAGVAKSSAFKAALAASEATSSAKQAQDTSGTAFRQSEAVGKRADELTTNLTETGKQLELLNAKRAELEKSLINLAVCNAPRVIDNWFIGVPGRLGAKSYIDPLRPMAGQTVFIEVVPDEEARRAAFNIAQALIAAKWNLQMPLKLVDGLADGVSIQPSEPTFTGLANGEIANMNPYWHANDTAGKLVEFLHSYNWQAKQGVPLDPEGKMIRDENVLPAGAIRIQIGLYPPTVFVSPLGAKDFAEAITRFDQQREATKKQMEKEQAERDEELFKHLTPQQVSEYKVRKEQRKKEDEQLRERWSEPCQLLTPLSPSIR
jgi:hypothetical protein